MHRHSNSRSLSPLLRTCCAVLGGIVTTSPAAIANGGMDTVLRHHIKLASPKRIIAFGANILPLLGHDRAQDVTSLREINHDGASTPLLVSEGLDSLMSMPRLKARLWRRWMEWSS